MLNCHAHNLPLPRCHGTCGRAAPCELPCYWERGSQAQLGRGENRAQLALGRRNALDWAAGNSMPRQLHASGQPPHQTQVASRGLKERS